MSRTATIAVTTAETTAETTAAIAATTAETDRGPERSRAGLEALHNEVSFAGPSSFKEEKVLASSYPFLNSMGTMLVFFVWLLSFWLLSTVIAGAFPPP